MMDAHVEHLAGVGLLWCQDWWDGPVSGTATYQGRIGWFEAVFDEAADDYFFPRCYVLYALTEAQRKQELERHRLRGEKLGGNRQNQRQGERHQALLEYLAVYPYGSHAPLEAGFRANPIIGWFMLSPAEWHYWRWEYWRPHV